MAAKLIDLTGMKFNKLTVLGLNEEESNKKRGKSGQKQKYWDCLCECGNMTTVRGGDLKSLKTKSCGCHRQQVAGKTFSKYNTEQWQDEEYRKTKTEQMSETSRKMWQNEEHKHKMSDLMRERWDNEEFKQTQYNSVYKGGITPISIYLRSLQIVRDWRKNTYIRENSKCQLTGEKVHGGNSDVHHLKGFNTIVREAHSLYNIQIKEIIADYTDKELKLLEEYIVKWHKDTTNAVLLSEEIHSLFHNIYGSGDNTPEQYMEFKERYLAGEFKEILK